jgi:DNA-binding transcriptional ArsR family regulator
LKAFDQEEEMSAVKTGRAAESSLAAVVGHPIRVQALTILTERVASPKEIAHAIEEEVGLVSYHVRVLKELGMIEVVDEQKRRGAIEHFYRGVARPSFTDEEWAALSLEERRPVSLYALQLAFADAAAALEAGTLDSRPDRYVTRLPGLVDADGWSELNALHREILDRTLEVQAASAERMARDPEKKSIPISTVTMFFEKATS